MPFPAAATPEDAESTQVPASLLDNLVGVLYRCRPDPARTAEFVSAGVLELSGYPAGDFVENRRTLAELVHPDDRARIAAEIEEAVPRGERFTLGYRIVTAAGAERWVQERGRGVLAPDGSVRAVEGFLADVTEWRAADQARAREAKRLEGLYQANPVATWEEDFSRVRSHLESLGLLGRNALELREHLTAHPEVVEACTRRVRVLDANPAALRQHRARTKEELLSGVSRWMSEDSRDVLVAQLVAIALGSTDFRVDTRVRLLDGRVRDVHLHWSAVPGHEARLDRVIVCALDITDRRRAEDEARLLQVLARGIGEAADEDRALSFLLRHVCEATGWTLGEAWSPSADGSGLLCRHQWSPPEPRLLEFQAASRVRVFARGEGLAGRCLEMRQPVWVTDIDEAGNFPRREVAMRAGLKAALGVPVLANGEVVLVLGFFLQQRCAHDRQFVDLVSAVAAQLGLLIERKRIADALTRERALAESTLRSLPGIFYLFDDALRLQRWNENFERATGYASSELAGLPPDAFVAPEDHALVRGRIAQVFSGGSSDVEASLISRDGTRTPYLLTGVRVHLEGRAHLVGTGVNIQPLKETQRDLARSLREFTALHEIARRLGSDISLPATLRSAVEAITASAAADTVLIFQARPEGLVLLNQAESGTPGCPAGGGRVCWGECLCGTTARTRTPWYSTRLVDDALCTRRECKAAGIVSFAALPLVSDGELLGVLGIASREPRDFSRQALFFEALAGQVALSLRNALLYEKIGRHAAELEREVAGRRQAEAALRLQASALNAAANAIVITDAGGVIEWVNSAWTTLTGYTRDETVGRTPSILKSGRQDAAYYERFWKTLRSGATLQGSIINRRKDGSLYHEHQTITPLADPAGRIAHFIAIKQDISERIALEEQLRQSQKMEAVGKLAGGVAHDFNNLLTIIQGNCSIALCDGISDRERQEALTEISRAGERAASLTRQLLAFGRRQVMQPRPLDLNEAITLTARMLQRLIGEDIQLHLELCPQPLRLHADPGMLDQLLMNLAVNARDAMPQGGRLTVATTPHEPSAEDAQHLPDLRAGPHACVRVSDTGSGIAPEHLPHVFEPFFTTKEPGKGTGLGLATVFGIVQQHGGAIRVASRVGEGSVFEVLLPLDQAPGAPPEAAATPEVPGGRGETILVVEDEPALRRLAVRVLTSYGYRVIEACDAQDALHIVSERRPHFDLLLTDMIMPGGMTGRELADTLRASRADLRVVFMSGYTGDRGGRDLYLREGYNFLQKPFTAEALLQCLRLQLAP